MKNILLLLVFILSFSSFANTGEYLIKEMEDLRESLDVDDPGRVELTLRLADLYFDVSIKEENGKNTKANKEIQRKRAFSLYESSLIDAKSAKNPALTRVKILFQMGRLATKLDDYKKAEGYYLQVFKDAASPKKLKEQSALALGEWYEEDARFTQANGYYEKAISLCSAKETCNYIHYRRAWLFYKDTKLEKAVAEIKLSLWDMGGNIRENSLTDMIMFMSNLSGNGEAEYSYIDGLSKKTNRPNLHAKLTEAFYAAGNRNAGSNLLAKLNTKNPTIYNEVRLLEEFYGFRNWDKVEEYLTRLEDRKKTVLPANKEKSKEVLETLRRYVVQVDAESQVAEDLLPILGRSIDIYLKMYPNDKLRKNMQQGWLKAQPDKNKKLVRLGSWIKEDIAFGKSDKEIRKLRQTRLSLAQKLNKPNIVIEDSLAIAQILNKSQKDNEIKSTDEADQFTYIAAREYYSQKKFKEALPLFDSLTIKAAKTEKASKWAVLSQNLTLDIYNQSKDYASIMKQVSLWKSVPTISSNKTYKKDFENFDRIYTQAEFEAAASLGETQKGLETFYNFCFQGVYPKKSCPNAKVLSVKLKDQPKLVALLEKEKDEKALVNEYELMGRFSDAAKLQEKLNLNRKSDYDTYLKIALLYELDQNFPKRDRILKKVITKIKRSKSIDPKYETALFVTLDEAGLINEKSLGLPWSLNKKIQLANRFEALNNSLKAKKFILSQKESTGPQWSKLVLAKIQKQYAKPSRINFYGRSSKWKYKKRVKAIDRFAKYANKYLEGSDAETRIYILQMLKATYEIMGIELQSTPIPEGLDEQTLASVMNQLADLAAPFQKVAADYQRLQEEELKAFAEKKRVIQNLDSGEENFVAFIKSEEIKKKNNLAEFDYTDYKKALASLHTTPDSVETISALESFYEKRESKRLAMYFKARKEQLK